jgi:hypothetical protein
LKPSEPEPLWRVVVGDPEPWRRGRLFLILFGALTLLNQALLLSTMILHGFIEALLGFGIMAVLFWLQFYFIWIGIHWVRWFSAAIYGLCGFWLTFWGIGSSSAVLFLSGLYTFVVSAYLGLAPAVYFFAQRQRETKRWGEAVAMGAVFLLLLLALAASVLGLFRYKGELEAEAFAFANEAFERVFAKHDTYFALEHTTAESLRKNGRVRMTQFLQDATIRAGDVREIKPAHGELQFRYAFPVTLATEGYVMTEGIGEHGAIQLHMRINDFEGAWRMEDVAWIYPHSDPKR